MVKRLERLTIAATLLNGMLSSPGVVDRTKVDKKKWARIAFAWAEALIEVEDELWNPMSVAKDR